MKKKTDLNSIIIRDNHGRQTFQKFVRSRVILTALLILFQVFLILFFALRLQQYIQYYFLFSIFLSVGFMVSLTNKPGRNEFKIAWFIPLMIFPLFGVIFYLIYHTDSGEKRARKALQESKAETAAINGPFVPAEDFVIRKYPETHDLQKYLITQSFPPYENTQVQYFPNGEAFFEDFITSLKSARKYIFLETFIIKIEETWDMILNILSQKAREGVEIRVMYDAFGSQMAAEHTYVNYLASKGIKACVFNPMIPVFTTKQNSRDHRKIYIIDGEICYTGGLNLANEYFNYGNNRFPYWKDNAIKLQGKAIHTFTTMFLQNWNMQQKNRKLDNYGQYLNTSFKEFPEPGLVIPYGDDSYNSEDVAENVYLYITHSAKKYLHITSPYIILDNNFQESLIFAAKRGIDVKLIVPSVPDHKITFYIGKTFLKTLVENGIKVYLYKKGFIHAKTFTSDDRLAALGSINLDYRSFYHHFECGTVMYDVPAISEIESDFQQTLLDCVEMKPGDYEKIPLVQRHIGKIFRIFAPLM